VVTSRFCRAVTGLALAGALSFRGMTAAAAAETNIALNRPYRCSVPVLIGWTGLVDGNHTADTAPECFATANVAKYPKYITIDLGAVSAISRVVVYNSANGNTKKVSIECSVDGQQYEQLRQGYIFPDRMAMSLSHQFNSRQARHVRLTIHDSWGNGLGGDDCIFLREVEVFGTRPQIPTQQPANPLASFKGQPISVSYPALKVFRRYCLSRAELPLRMAVLGDSFAAADEEDQSHWGALLAILSEQRYGKTPEVSLLGSNAFTPFDCQLFLKQQEGRYPDLVLLTLGHDATVARRQMAEFTEAAGDTLELLAETTDAMVVVVTPPPVMHDRNLKRYEVVANADTTPYAWQLEVLAQMHKLPLVRSAAALANSGYGPADLYEDNLQLSHRGHEAVAIALDRLLAGE